MRLPARSQVSWICQQRGLVANKYWKVEISRLGAPDPLFLGTVQAPTWPAASSSSCSDWSAGSSCQVLCSSRFPLPILDAVAEQGRIRFIPARGEAGAMNMADAFSRVSGGLGVALTSTGTAAGNAAGAQAEALTAGGRVLHITTQIDRPYMDRDRAAIHDVPKQPEMLKGVSKAVFRIWDEMGVLGTVAAAVRAAMTPPTGPVSLEIPVDVQRVPAMPGQRLGPPARDAS